MKCFKLIRGAAVALATLGIVLPNAPAMAAGQNSTARPSVRMVDAKVFDIALSKDGTLAGRVVDHTGVALEGAQVTVKQRNKEVATSITDKSGSFAVGNLKSGVYTVSSGATSGTYRTWTEKSAPPSAKPQALLVTGQNGARGQFGCCDPCCDGGGLILLATGAAILGVGIAALVIGVENQHSLSTVPHSP
jgi:Carboxypeptidase regulatory-like domain